MTIPIKSAVCLGFLLTLNSGTYVEAHHSRAPFDIEHTQSVKIKVDRVIWKNPHIYLFGTEIGSSGELQEWVFEGHSVAGLKRLGWSPDTVKVGDVLQTTFNPRLKPSSSDSAKMGLLDNIVLEDGSKYYAFRVPSGEDASRVENRDPKVPSSDFSGTWSFQRSNKARLIGAFAAPKDWPLTEIGEKQVEAYDPDTPIVECRDRGLTGFVPAPYGHRWTRDDNTITLTRELSDSVRTIHLNQPSKLPPNYKPTPMGYSTGVIDSNTVLHVSTIGISGTFWGNAFGLNSSDQQTFTESYTLTDDGYGLDVTYTISDPVYLTEPVTLNGSYKKQSDYEFSMMACDAETAQLHLKYETDTTPPTVPENTTSSQDTERETSGSIVKLLGAGLLALLGLLIFLKLRRHKR